MRRQPLAAAVRQRYVPALRGGEIAQEQQASRVRFTVDVPFTKAATLDPKGNLELVGYASTWLLDRDGEYIDPRAFDDSLEPYLQTNPMVLWQHNMDWPLGQVVQAQVDANGLMVRAVIRKPEPGEEPYKLSAYNDIAAGIVRTFSIGGFFTRDFSAGRVMVTEVELLEISVVSIPSNPGSIFEAAQKALGKGVQRPALPQAAIDQMEQLLGLRTVTDPELVVIKRRGAAAMEERYELLCGLYTRAGKQAPGRAVWEEAKDVADPHARLHRVLDVMQLVQGRVDSKAGRVLSKKNEDAIQQAAELLNGVLAQLAKDDAEPAGEADKGLHDYKGDGGPCKVCGEPPTHANHGGKGAQPEDKGSVPAKRTWPIADRARPWDASAAETRVRSACGAADAPNAKYDSCFFWRAGSTDSFSDRKLLFCDVIDGKLTAVPRGIFAVAVVLQGGRGGVDVAGDEGKVKSAVASYYKRMASQFNDDNLKPPWAS